MSSLLQGFSSSKIPLVEIFQSVSGEGLSAGNIVSFVRVAGCDLRCTWCDTKYSFNESGNGIEELYPADIEKRLKELGVKELICTGGEPLEHGKTKRYLPAYLHSVGYDVRIETSGASNLYSKEELSFFELSENDRPVYTMDIKCPASKMEGRNNFNNIQLLDSRDELKFVVANQRDLEYALEIINSEKETLSLKRIPLNFSPVFESMNSQYLVDFLKSKYNYFTENDLYARLSLQLHKFIWPPHQRGV